MSLHQYHCWLDGHFITRASLLFQSMTLHLTVLRRTSHVTTPLNLQHISLLSYSGFDTHLQHTPRCAFSLTICSCMSYVVVATAADTHPFRCGGVLHALVTRHLSFVSLLLQTYPIQSPILLWLSPYQLFHRMHRRHIDSTNTPPKGSTRSNGACVPPGRCRGPVWGECARSVTCVPRSSHSIFVIKQCVRSCTRLFRAYPAVIDCLSDKMLCVHVHVYTFGCVLCVYLCW